MNHSWNWSLLINNRQLVRFEKNKKKKKKIKIFSSSSNNNNRTSFLSFSSFFLFLSSYPICIWIAWHWIYFIDYVHSFTRPRIISRPMARTSVHHVCHFNHEVIESNRRRHILKKTIISSRSKEENLFDKDIFLQPIKKRIVNRISKWENLIYPFHTNLLSRVYSICKILRSRRTRNTKLDEECRS